MKSNKEQFYQTLINSYANASSLTDLALIGEMIDSSSERLSFNESVSLGLLHDTIVQGFNASNRVEKMTKQIEKLDEYVKDRDEILEENFELSWNILELVDIIENILDSNEKLLNELRKRDKFFIS